MWTISITGGWVNTVRTVTVVAALLLITSLTSCASGTSGKNTPNSSTNAESALTTSALTAEAQEGREVLGGGHIDKVDTPQRRLVTQTQSRPGAMAAPQSCTDPLPPNWIKLENLNAGSSDWEIRSGQALSKTVGYASTSTATCGDSVTIYASSRFPFHIETWRMGYYGGAGGRLMSVTELFPPQVQYSDQSGLGNAANWAPTTTITIPAAWIPGVYLLKLVPTRGSSSYIPLVVRGGSGQILMPLATHTWQAYNFWGGASAYVGGASRSPDLRLRQLSANRPYRGDHLAMFGDGQFLLRDYPAVWALEKWGFPVTYTTDDYLDVNHDELAGKSLIVFGGHSEYMTPATFHAIQQSVDAGTNVLNLGANAAYWRIRNEPDRIMTIYKSAVEDVTAPSEEETTVQFREQPAAMPEATLWGAMYDCPRVAHAAAVVTNASLFPWAGLAGITDGTELTGVVDGEADHVFPGVSPASTDVLAHADFACPGRSYVPKTWDLVYHADPGKGGVFSAGTFGWVCALSYSCDPFTEPLTTQRILGVVTQHFIAAALRGPLGDSHPSTGTISQSSPAS